ncbi:hypothetical protein QJQ45_025636 [Haematococcus lacustris]|nr:hypothetical protein QJQ45_025636 [Haematococcus lacustris]
MELGSPRATQRLQMQTLAPVIHGHLRRSSMATAEDVQQIPGVTGPLRKRSRTDQPSISTPVWPVKAMVDKKRGVKAMCANALKASEVMAPGLASRAAPPGQQGSPTCRPPLFKLGLCQHARSPGVQGGNRCTWEQQLTEQQQQLQQQLTEQQQQLEQQQADLHLRELQVTEQQQQLQLQQQLHRLQQQVKQQLQEVVQQLQVVSTNHPLPDHLPCSCARTPALHRERAWQLAAQTSATRATAQRVHSAAPTALLTTSNRFATLRVADEQEQQLPSQPAKLDEHQAAAAAIALAAVAPVLRVAVEAEGQEQGEGGQGQQEQGQQVLGHGTPHCRLQPLLDEFQQYPVEGGAELLDRLQQHRRMRYVVSLATGLVPPPLTRPVLAGIKPAPGGHRSTNQQPCNTALAMIMGSGIEQHGIKTTARQLGITPKAVKRARRSHMSNLAAGPSADWAAAPLRRGRRCLSQEQLEYARSFTEEHSSPSPMSITQGHAALLHRSLKKLYLEYERQCPANLKVRSTTFELLRPPWVKRITAAHKQVCVCIPCETCELQLVQLGKHMNSLVVPVDPQPPDDSDSDRGSDSDTNSDGGDAEVHVMQAEHISNADAQHLAGVLDAGVLGARKFECSEADDEICRHFQQRQEDHDFMSEVQCPM